MFYYIARYEATSTVSSFSFTSIPQTYNDLYLVLSTKTNRTGGSYESNAIYFNTSSTAYQRRVYQEAALTGADQSTNTGGIFFGIAPSTGSAQNNDLFNSQTIYIPKYTDTNNNLKSAWSNGGYVSSSGAQQYSFNIYAIYAQSHTSITSFTVYPWEGNSYVQYSSATLYGIKNS
jgi:hypothetical protein